MTDVYFVVDHIVTADLLEQVPLIAAKATEHSADCSELKSIVNDYLITLVVKNIDNTKSVIPALTQLIEQGFINKTQVEIRICPTILSLSRSELNAAASVEVTHHPHIYSYLLNVTKLII